MLSLSLLKNRRSIRIFQNRKVEKEKIDQIVQAALLSPSSRNNNPWEFIIVEDEKVLLRLSKTKTNGSQFVSKTPLAIVVLADPKQSDVWIEDSSIATTLMIFTAQHLGLGSCWIQLRKRNHTTAQSAEKFVQDLLGIPDNFRVLCMIAIGYPDEEKPEKTIEEAKLDDVHLNRFGNKFIINNK
jgi:nitroreductase